MDEICRAVQATWDNEDPWRPSDNGYYGSEDYIRLQFEEYIMHLLASVKYDVYLKMMADKPQVMAIRDVKGNPIKEYNLAWVQDWKISNSYRIFNKFTDSDIFDVVEPRHVANPSAVSTITRQIDEKLTQPAKDGIKSGVSRMFVLWSGSKEDVGTKSERATGESPLSPAASTRSSGTSRSGSSLPSVKDRRSLNGNGVDAEGDPSSEKAEVTSQEPARGGYFSGWGKWASDRSRGVFGKRSTSTPGDPTDSTDSASASGEASPRVTDSSATTEPSSVRH
jgi:hypothetical protein